MKKNITKYRLKTFLVFFSFLLVIVISLSFPTYADQVQTPSCTCPKGDISLCDNNISHTAPTTTIWVEKSGNQYIIHGGNQDGDVYYPGTTILQGTSGSDLIIGSHQGDIIEGGDGHDTICGEPDSGGGAGQDDISGGPGDDYICGGKQDDVLNGNSGNDLIEGNNGKDSINGGPGDDCLYGNNANDEIGGGSGDNYIDGGNGGQDTCYTATTIVDCENVQAPQLKIEKKTLNQDADVPIGPLIEEGTTVSWSYEVTNLGTANLNDIKVTDDMGTSDDTSDDAEICTVSLNGGSTTTCNESGTAQMGQYSNEAEARKEEGTNVYTDTDPSHYFGTAFSVSDQVLEAQITQEGNLDQWNSGTISNIQFKPKTGTQSYSLEVTFAYPSGYDVSVDYTVDLGEASPGSLQKDPLILDSAKNHEGDISEKYIPRDGNGTLELRSEGDFDGVLTQTDGDFSQKYDLFVDPQKLVEDYSAEDVLTFTINFTVSEDST